LSAYGETLAGVTRLSGSFGGIGSPRTVAIVNTALRFVDTTNPVGAVGAGIILQGGPFVVDVGYRFSRIFARDAFAGLLTGGNLDVNEARIGVGVRF
jgi:opacity protein-like surface antigen